MVLTPYCPSSFWAAPPTYSRSPHRQGPDDRPPVFPGNNGGGVRLFIVTAQLCKDLVEADTYGQGQPQLPFHPLPDGIRQCLGVPAEQVEGVGHVQPAFVDAEGLRQIGIFVINGIDLVGIFPIQLVMGGKQHQIGAFLLGLPDGLGGFDSALLGRLVFR